ncbi:hypothetical protein H072_9091 [Dactylellina haptotyla CBS 200.50]|uniref:Uncharacterized protein n=1 Tax=Dactylellina haptotyla (strain CBS 200.50) TaxID=1284197 RepID=S8BPZ1_DACHA|nr:hypothetical protein H072_9091 [Dactylellina haptotyla CBS 200.50]
MDNPDIPSPLPQFTAPLSATPASTADPAKDEFSNEFTQTFTIDPKDQLGWSSPPTRNPLGGAVTRDTITEVEISKTYLSARVSQVSYGTYKSRNAAIIVLDFVFHSSDHRRQRFKDATIEIDFTEDGVTRSGDAGTSQLTTVSIAQFAPKLIHGEKKAEDVTWGWDLSVGANLVAGPATLEIANSTVYRESKYSRDHKLVIEGSARGTGPSRLVWSLQERKHDGIPGHFTTAFMVFHPKGYKFSARMNVRASIGFSLDPRRWKIFIPNDDKLYFHDEHPKGPKLDTDNFDAFDFGTFYKNSLQKTAMEPGSYNLFS